MKSDRNSMQDDPVKKLKQSADDFARLVDEGKVTVPGKPRKSTKQLLIRSMKFLSRFITKE